MALVAESVLKYYDDAASRSVLVEVNGGGKYVIQCKDAGNESFSAAVDEIVLGLARLAGILVPAPAAIVITPYLAQTANDAAVRKLLQKNLGVRLGTEYLPRLELFSSHHRESINPQIRNRIFCFDLLFLNVKRTIADPNMAFRDHDLYCLSFSSSMTIRMLIDGQEFSEELFIPLMRQHPFCLPKKQLRIFEPTILSSHIQEVVELIPDEWLENSVSTKAEITSGCLALINDAHSILERRLRFLDALVSGNLKEQEQKTQDSKQALDSLIKTTAQQRRKT